jgi:hypothetical protein
MMKPMFLSNHLVGWDPPVSRSAKPGEKSLGSVPLPGWRFHRACYRLCGGVRVWFDFVWCQRISAEIKIEIQSTSLNFGEKTGVQSLTKKGLAYFDMCCPSTKGILPCAWIHLLGWSFHNSPRPAMCPLACGGRWIIPRYPSHAFPSRTWIRSLSWHDGIQ